MTNDNNKETQQTPSDTQSQTANETGHQADSLQGAAQKFAAKAKAAGQIAAKEAEIAKIKSTSLPTAYLKLGKWVYQSDFNREQLANSFDPIAAIDKEIQSLSETAEKQPQAEGIAAKAKALAKSGSTATQIKVLQTKRKKALYQLGKAAFEPENLTEVPGELVQNIRSPLGQLKELEEQIESLQLKRDIKSGQEESTDSAQTFRSWYEGTWLASLNWFLQVPIWLIFGFAWVPAWYFFSATPSGSMGAKWKTVPFPEKALLCVAMLFTVGVFWSLRSVPTNESDVFAISGRPIEVSVTNAGIESNPWLLDFNASLTNISCIAAEGDLAIEFDLNDPPTMPFVMRAYPLLVRLFDKNGQYLTHFTTSEKFTNNAETYKDIREARQRLLDGGNASEAAKYNAYLLKTQGNQLTYPVNIRDLRDTSMVEIGFIGR